MGLFAQRPINIILVNNEDISGYVKLWRAVIDMAVNDIVKGRRLRNPAKKSLHSRQAEEWMFRKTRQFYDACYLGLLEPSIVLKEARDFINARVSKKRAMV